MDAKRAIEEISKFHGFSKDGNEACDMAIEALEKQIAKKPNQNEHYYACPSCGVVRSIRQKHDYCQKCGQEFDWGESEDE